MDSGKAVLGLLAGLAIGATLGILLAPDKGSATWKKLSDGSGHWAEALGDKMNEFIETMTQKFEEAKGEAKDKLENGKEKVKEFGNETSTAAARMVR